MIVTRRVGAVGKMNFMSGSLKADASMDRFLEGQNKHLTNNKKMHAKRCAGHKETSRLPVSPRPCINIRAALPRGFTTVGGKPGRNAMACDATRLFYERLQILYEGDLARTLLGGPQ